MTKKIFCLVLAVLFVLPLFAACSKDEDSIAKTTDEASRYTTTLNMWVITESELIASVSDLAKQGLNPEKEEKDQTDAEKAQLAALSAEQREALAQLYKITTAINKITKLRYKIKLNINYITEAQYYERVEAAFAESKEAAKSGAWHAADDKDRVEETEVDAFGVPELKYPEVPDYEIDILYIGNYDKYREYASAGYLASLGATLESDQSVLLNYYVNPVLLANAQYEGVLWGVPVNHGIGEYTYMILDRAIVEEYGYTVSQFENRSLYDRDCRDLLEFVKGRGDGTYPLYTESGKVDLGLVHYWSFTPDAVSGLYDPTPDKFSIFGSIYNNTDARGTRLNYTNLLTDTTYRDRLAAKLKYETEAGYITTDPDAPSAVKIVKGGWELQQKYRDEGYEVLIMESPRATDEDVFGSVFSVGNWSTRTERAVEIITCFNTDKELRNLFQYGVEYVNYNLQTVTVDEKEYTYAVEKEGNLYQMDLRKTGNEFLTYPNSAATVLAWEYEKRKNLQVTTDPTLGFYFDPTMKVNTTAIAIIEAVSAAMGTYMEENLTTPAAVTAFYAETAALPAGNREAMANFILGKIGADVTYDGTNAVTTENLKGALSVMGTAAIDEAKDAVQSPLALYGQWLKLAGFVES